MEEQENYNVNEEETKEFNEINSEIQTIYNEQYTLEEKHKVKISLIRLLIFFILSTIIYYIAKAHDPFKNIEMEETTVSVFLKYVKYIMVFSNIIAIIGIILLVLYLLKIELKIKKKTLKNIIDVFEWLVIFPICVAVATFCFSFVFTFTIVEGDSMLPNYQNGDQLFLFYTKKLERFDCIVIDVDEKYDARVETLYIKRIIGMPGEYIEYRFEENENGEMVTNLYVNNEFIDEYFFSLEQQERYPTFIYGIQEFNLEEICLINNLNYETNSEGQVVIPEDYYLVLGDNRPNSKDSRTIGLIHKDDIIGKIKFKVESGFIFKKTE